MNPTAIYSKSGKGVQEAAGKTSLLKRPDRAVLAAIDGRATLEDVAQKVGKPFDAAFQGIIAQLDKAGFIREVSAGTVATAAPAARPAAAPAPRPAAKRPEPPSDPASDLDFSNLGKPSVPPKEQESALFKARKEAEAKALAERERRRAESEAKLKAEAEAKIKAAQEAAARAAGEAKAKAEAEARRAREEAERIRKEAEEKARREAEELRQRLEEERKAREEAERKAREEAERKAREEAERIRREAEEEARKAREEAERMRRQVEEERRQLAEERRRQEEERSKEAQRRREEEERRQEEARREEERRRACEEAEAKAAAAAPVELEPPPEAPPAAEVPPEPQAEPEREPAIKAEAKPEGFSDSLMADLEAFTLEEEREAAKKEEAERKAKEEADRRAREEAQRHAAAQAKHRAEEETRRKREDKERRRKEEEERLAREEEERKTRFRAEEERRERQAEERRRKAMEEEALARKAVSSTPAEVPDPSEARRRAMRNARVAPPSAKRKPARWGRRTALVLFLLLAAGAGTAQLVPLSTVEYERHAAEALGRPVRIADGRLWLLTGPQLRFEGVSVGDVKIARVIARPKLLSLLGEQKAFSSLELHGMRLPQEALGEALFGRIGSERFAVERIVVKGLELPGLVPLSKELEGDVTVAPSGAVRSATVRGPEGLVARLAPKGSSVEFDLQAGSFALPIAPQVSLAQFSMKGLANRQGMQIAEWDGAMLNGTLSGTAKIRWGRTWSVDGVLTARGINAAVFAPALLSEGSAQGTGKFSMSGADPAKLGSLGHFEGNFTIHKGVLGSFDLSRAIQTDGKSPQGRTQFAEMTGHAVYTRGTVALRNVMIGAGALNAGASADIAQNGALSGRIVADVRTAAETLRATLNLGGTLKEPQVRN